MVEGQGLVGRGGEDHRACSVPRYAGALLAHAYLTTLRCAQCSLGALMPRSHSDLVVAVRLGPDRLSHVPGRAAGCRFSRAGQNSCCEACRSADRHAGILRTAHAAAPTLSDRRPARCDRPAARSRGGGAGTGG